VRPIRQTWAQTEPWGRERTLAALALLAVATVAALVGAGALSRNGLNIAATLFVYIALAEAWNILAGLSGQVSLGVGAFVGAGAYAMGLVMVHAGFGLLAGLVVAAGAGGLLGLILTVPLLRLRGDYFAVGTLAAALALQAWLLNWDFAGGSTGLSLPVAGIPSLAGLYYLGLAVGVLGIGAAVLVRGSRFGLRLLAIREHEEAAATLGVNTWRMRAAALVLSSVLMGLAGGAFALMQLSFEPTGMVGMNWTIWALMMVVIGGFGTITGPIIGAVFVYYVVATELASYPTLGLFIEGALLIIIVRFAPRGIVPLVVDGIKAGLARRRRAHPGQPRPAGTAAGTGPAARPPGRTVRPLTVQHLVKHFGNVVATDQVSFRVEPGEAVGLIGPNGSGKSTLLKLIAGIETPDSGSVALGDTVLTGREPHLVSRLGIAVAMQVPRPFPDLTVQENVRLAAGHHTRQRGGEHQTAGEVLELCGLRQRAHAKAGSLGLLDLKRLEFARALATDPAVILLDEVAAGLVGAELAEVIALIKRVNATGRSVIVVEHVQQVISEVVDRVLVLSSGKLIAAGTPAEIAANAEVAEVYYGARAAGAPAPVRATAAAAAAGALAPPPVLLELDNVSAGYGALLALRDVNLAIRQTDIVSVLGANGAGKSTLAATVSGQVRARRGTIRFDGHPVTRTLAYDRARQGICLCPEGRGIFTGLTVAENLLLGVPLRRRRGDIAAGLDRVYEILPVLRSRAGQRAGSLSGGEQQMLAIGRALLMSPRLLICDELSLGLAPKIAEELYGVLQRVNKSGVAILLIEQNVHRALEICTTAYVLNRGQVTYTGPPGELRDESLLDAAYFASGARAAAGPGPEPGRSGDDASRVRPGPVV
jgi:ABC-type branched-subunit amino acid transport system ATPase component/ABC-type branched-subunit amino acid transport system permease subunit